MYKTYHRHLSNKRAFCYFHNVFGFCLRQCHTYVPSGTKEKYKATSGWWGFKNIVENDLLYIDDGQFVDTENDIVNVYDLNGHRITSPQRGVNIVRLKDGTVRKVLVK